MTIDLHEPGDLQRLQSLVDRETNAKQRDRYRVVLLAGRGEEEKPLFREQIASRVGRSRQFVDEWVGRYRRGGIDALVARKQPGAKSKLNDQQQRELCEMLDAGPDAAEGLAAYNGPILREKIHQRFGVLYCLSGTYDLLHRLGYNDLMPRPLHPDTDPLTQEEFKKKSCLKRSPKPRRITPANVS